MSLTNEQYEQISRIYDERQYKSRRIQAQRTEEVERRAPRIRQIKAEMASCSVKQAKLLLDGDKNALSSLHQQLEALQQEKDQIMESLGYPMDYLEPVYECPDCKDTGYINGEKCHCFRQLAIRILYRQSNIHLSCKGEDFEHFNLSYYSEEDIDETRHISSREAAEMALAECQGFVKTFSSAFRNLFLYGDVGTGKTFLTHCIAKELLDQGYSVLYFGASDLFEVLSNQAFHRDDADPEGYQLITGCDLLIIDDLGTEFSNSFTTTRIFSLLNDRLIRQKPVVISTNLNLDQVNAQYSERLASRIASNYTMIKMFGEDIRVQKKISKIKVAQG